MPLLAVLAPRARLRRQVRLVRSSFGGPPLTGPYRLKVGYVSRAEALYIEQDKWTGIVVWQPDVYPRAAALARELDITRIVDLGCGTGSKLVELGGFETVGVDFGPNLEVCRSRYPERAWIEHDLDSDEPLPVGIDGSLVICADVIEHLRHPERLLAKLRPATMVVLTTPDRDLSRGVSDMGPPVIPAHVREWNRREFRAFLESAGFDGRLSYTRTRDTSPLRNTILAIGNFA